MKALTLHQPWASLIEDGCKRYETRSWAPPADLIGQRIAIHAGAKRSSEQANLARDWGMDDLPLGAVVCTARLVAAHLVWVEHRDPDGSLWATAAKGSIESDADPDYDLLAHTFPIDEYGDYSPGRWAWRFDQVIQHDPPVPARGYQGLWEWTP